MRLTNLGLGLALVAGLIVAAPTTSYVSAQDAPAAVTFNEDLLVFDENVSSEDLLKQMGEISSSLRDYLNSSPSEEEQADILKRANDFFKEAQAKLAFAEDLDPQASFMYFRNYTMGLARENELDALKKIAKTVKDPDRVGWVDYLVLAVSLDNAEGAELTKLLPVVEKKLLTQPSFASHAEEFVQMIGAKDKEASKELFGKILKEYSKSDKPEFKDVANRLMGKERFMNLVGNEMKVEGLFLDGTEIKWEEYRGKVVLIDFWATWCGPCVGEIPNVQDLYGKYHDAGFEVIGYSLDQDLEALEKFEEERQLPWKTASRLLSKQANEKDGKNYEDLSAYYGVNAIPTMILVGKDGKVLDTGARGAHLRDLLAEQFPEVK